MYTSGRTVKSTAAKQNVGLTVTKATSQARRIADRIMPGAGVTVESRLSHDLATDTPTVVTTITHPTGHEAALALWTALFALPGVIRNGSRDSARMVITRKA